MNTTTGVPSPEGLQFSNFNNSLNNECNSPMNEGGEIDSATLHSRPFPRCVVINGNGEQCTRSRVDISSPFCVLHYNYIPRRSDQCKGYTRKGKQCSLTKIKDSPFCKYHHTEIPPFNVLPIDLRCVLCLNLRTPAPSLLCGHFAHTICLSANGSTKCPVCGDTNALPHHRLGTFYRPNSIKIHPKDPRVVFIPVSQISRANLAVKENDDGTNAISQATSCKYFPLRRPIVGNIIYVVSAKTDEYLDAVELQLK